MSKKLQPPLSYRSFHLTVGGLLLADIAGLDLGIARYSVCPLAAIAWILCLPIVGIGFLAFGIFASDQKIVSIRIVAFDSTILLAILAVPLYLVCEASASTVSDYYTRTMIMQ